MAKKLKNENSARNLPNTGPLPFFFLTYVGTLVYFLDKANGFWEIALSFLQALVWPALLVNKVFTVLHI